MRVLVLEFITGGGLFSDPEASPPHGSLLAEGRAMARAITADLQALPDVEVFTTLDARLAPFHATGCQVTFISSAVEERDAIPSLAAEADWTLLIAPETGDVLLTRAQQIEAAGGRLLFPSQAVIQLAASKQATADWLVARGIRAPRGKIVDPSRFPAPDIRFPAVLKPLDSCGSQEVRLIRTADELAELVRCPMRLEPFVPGLAASVAVLCGPSEQVALPACEQRLSTDGRFNYLGGRTPLAPALDRRARQLSLAAVATLPNPIGYLGVDLVLGNAADGSGDHVIEINPRLTTSYVGLRAACRDNLAAAMLAVATGRPVALSFHAEPVEFSADGTIARA